MIGRRLLLSTASKRTMATSSGGATGVNRESTFVRVWIKAPEAWPVFAIVAGALTFSAYKIFHDLSGPDYHFNRHERSTIDYVENNKDPAPAVAWGQTAFHKGPQFIRERLIKRE